MPFGTKKSVGAILSVAWLLTLHLMLLAALSSVRGEDLRQRSLVVTCQTDAVIKEKANAANLFARAVTNAFAVGCSSSGRWRGGDNQWGIPNNVLGLWQNHEGKDLRDESPRTTEHGRRWRKNIYRRIKASFKQWGLAYARAIAYTQITCSSDNATDPYECNTSKVVATANAEARAEFVANATAAAFNNCHSCQLTAEVQAEVNAQMLLQLTANATARVTAKVCVGAGGTASAEGYMKCYGEAMARGFAKVVAKAMLKGNCFRGLTAAAKVRAHVEADSEELCACKGWVRADAMDNGVSRVETFGRCDAYVEAMPLPP